MILNVHISGFILTWALSQLQREMIFQKGYNFNMNESREIYLGERLSELGLTISVAESFTGGMIAHVITNAPGSSIYFQGGVIAYANEVKMDILEVAEQTLIDHGAVSRETVLEMARGVRKALDTDIGISSSGIAGPDGGSPEKPVGLAWIGLSGTDTEYAEKFLFVGNRLQIKELAVQSAIERLIDLLPQLTQAAKAKDI